MRIFNHTPEIGATRTITRFAWYPMSVFTIRSDASRDTEWRWLERVTIKQEYRTRFKTSDRWINVKFINEGD